MRRLGWAVAVCWAIGCASSKPAPSPGPNVAELLSAPDRSARDRERDSTRNPEQTLSFMGVGSGQRVAEVGAGGGYTSELLARAVGPTGTVFAHNSPTWSGPGLDKAWAERLANPVNARVVRVSRPWEDPLPPEARNLDGVYSVMVYHDVIAEQHPAVQMNRAIFEALKPGGVYVVIDNSAVPGADTSVADRLHRIDEGLVRKQVEEAGFRLDGTADFLRNAADDRAWAVDPPPKDARAHTQDRFALRFVKPG